PEGRVVDKTLHSTILGEDRKLGLYLPPTFDAQRGPYPYVAFFDGESYGLASSAVPGPTILDNLIAQGRVPPMLGVFVENQGTRARDYTMSPPFCRFLAEELVPWLRREYQADQAPAMATLAGASLGGLCAAYCAFHHP